MTVFVFFLPYNSWLLLFLKDDEEGDEDDDDEGSEMELDEDFPDINAAPHIRFERFDRDDDLIIEFDNMFSNNGKSELFFSDLDYDKMIFFICTSFPTHTISVLTFLQRCYGIKSKFH